MVWVGALYCAECPRAYRVMFDDGAEHVLLEHQLTPANQGATN